MIVKFMRRLTFSLGDYESMQIEGSAECDPEKDGPWEKPPTDEEINDYLKDVVDGLLRDEVYLAAGLTNRTNSAAKEMIATYERDEDAGNA